jgi:hypothetical protein
MDGESGAAFYRDNGYLLVEGVPPEGAARRDDGCESHVHGSQGLMVARHNPVRFARRHRFDVEPAHA